MRTYTRLEELVPDGDWRGARARRLIPLPVLRSLRDGVPVEYDERRKRFSFPDGRGLAVRRREIAGARDGEWLWRFDQTIYPAMEPLAREVYLAAADALPESNFVYEAEEGETVGHLSCLPLRAEAYAALRDGSAHEGELRVSDIAADGAVYLCSMYAGHREAGRLLTEDLRGVRGVFGAMAVTAAGLAACQRAGMAVVREEVHQHAETEIVPVFLERR